MRLATTPTEDESRLDGMKISAVRTIATSYDATEPPMSRSFAIVRVESDSGLVGYGEAGSSYGHAYPTVVMTIVDNILARCLVGRDPLAIGDRLRDMHLWLDGYLGWDGVSSQAIGAVETALWDMLGKATDTPIYRLLGGSTEKLPLYATGNSAFDETPETNARFFDEALAHGIDALKVRLGNVPEADLALIAGTREYVGPDVQLMADSYWTYPPDRAIDLATRMAEYDVSFYEEPVPQYMIEALARVREASPVRIAVGERVFSLYGFREVVRHRAADVLQPDVTVCGGIKESMQIAALARAHDLPVVPHTGGATAIGFAANVHFAAAAGVELLEYDPTSYQPMLNELITDPIFSIDHIRNGKLSVPEGPGLGIDIDESVFERFPYSPGLLWQELHPDHGAGTLTQTQSPIGEPRRVRSLDR